MNRRIIGATVGTPISPKKIVEQVNIDTKANAIINSASGETILTTDSANSPLESMKTFGKSWQNSYGWNQLLEKIASAGLGETISEDGQTAITPKINGTSYVNVARLNIPAISVTAGTTYYISYDMRLLSGSISVIGRGTLFKGNASEIGTGVKVTAPTINSTFQRYVSTLIPTTDAEAKIIYIQGQSATDAVIEITNIMVSTVNTEWEPYVGGIPSPNPLYPQSIHSNGESGSIEYWVYGLNIFDEQFEIGVIDSSTGNLVASSQNLRSINFTQVCGNSTYYITQGAWIHFYDKSKNWIGAKYLSVANTFDTPSNAKFIKVQLLIAYGTTYNNDVCVNVSCEQNGIYEPYTKQPLILQTPNGLNGLKVTNESEANYKDADGNLWACDYVDFKRGKFVQRIVEKVLDGSESIGYNYGGVWHFSRVQLFGYEIVKPTPSNTAHSRNLNGYYIMSDRFLAQSTDYMCGADDTKDKLYCSDKGSTLNYITFNASRFLETQDADGFKKFFGEHPTKIYAILETPIETDLTEEEIAQYKALLMNYPNTTIINDANAYTEVEYVADTKNYIDGKFKQLETALASTNANLL